MGGETDDDEAPEHEQGPKAGAEPGDRAAAAARTATTSAPETFASTGIQEAATPMGSTPTEPGSQLMEPPATCLGDLRGHGSTT